jgi:hypothetical protein
MSDTTREATAHLALEGLERIAFGGEAAPAEGRHLAGCDRCRAEVADLRALHARLAALAPLAPSAGFADRVMARVQLPAPAWTRALSSLRAHPAAALAAAASALLTVVGGITWMVAYPEITPGAVAALLADRGTALAWQAVLVAGRAVYDSGIASLVAAFRADLTPWTAVAGLLTLALVAIGSMGVMLRLLDITPRLRPSRESER